MPAILAIAYASFVGSNGPVSSALSLIGCGAIFRVYAGGAKEQQPRYSRGHGSVEQVDLDLEVFGGGDGKGVQVLLAIMPPTLAAASMMT